MKTHNPKARSGVLLLIILAVLAMFGLIGVAFVMLSGQAQRSAKSVERIDQAYDPPRQTLNQALMQILRGPATDNAGIPSPASAIGAHCILEDMYGNGWASGPITIVGGACGGELIEFTIAPNAGVPIPVDGIAVRAGCVITMLNGQAAGQSSLIVGVNPAAPTHGQMLAFQGNAQPASGDTAVINGVPFGGTGFGWDATAGAFNANLAMQPNAAANRNPAGGANSDYTAADFQHMFLAAQVADPATGKVRTIPSFHRPALARYWKAHGAPDQHLYMMRPIGNAAGTDHPNFTGSNPGFDPTNFDTWDVDNDGDGIPDSIWIDLGLPVRATADGRLYKPLVAALILDMDGRLNVNAHGCLQQTIPAYTQPETPPGGLIFAGGAAPNLHRGMGFGPAEINLMAIPNFTPALCKQLLVGAGGLEGRYGLTANGQPGVAGVADMLNLNKWFAYGQNYSDFTNVNNAGAYGSPPDPYGQGVVALDAAGRPMYLAMGGTTIDNPYELDLSHVAAHGTPNPPGVGGVIPNKPNNLFSPAELERLLRPFDRDASGLPDRLARLTASTGQPNDSVLFMPGNRRSFTSESWDVPGPSVNVMPKAAGATRLTHVTDLLRTRGATDPTKWVTMLPPELLAGLKMNINRPFGNGRDDNDKGVIDAPPATGVAAENDQLTLSGSNVAFSYDGITYGGAGALAGNSLQARQLEARYLYVLMCLVADTDYLKTQLGSADEVARFLAQWAVNAVDFADRDSIMTRFDYDPKFADKTQSLAAGWTPPAPGDTAHRVWGCKRPELLISETLAFHDRRTENLDNETPDPAEPNNGAQESGAKYDPAQTDPKKQDVSFDQAYKPQGSLFVELYNPSSPMEPRSKELYTAPDGALDLTKVTGAGGGGGSPVWRLMIAIPTPDPEQPDPDDPAPGNPKPNFEREVYFVDPSAVTIPTPMTGKVQLFPSSPPQTTVAPGNYAIIGPGDKDKAAPEGKRTYIGFINGKTAGDPTGRYIDLNSPPTTPLVVKNNTNVSPPGDPNSNQINMPALMTIDENQDGRPRRLSVTEPVDGYTSAGLDPNTGKYSPPLDVPLDDPSKRPDGAGAVLQKDRTVSNYRVVYLQRLANPMAPYNNDPTSDDYNPYRTIDMMSIDVTAFNGVTADADPQAGDGAATHFQSRQRGESNDVAGRYNLWKQEPLVKTAWGAVTPVDLPAAPDHYFKKNLKNSLGYLNQPFGAPQTGVYVGMPGQPFPWLTWNNRPYVSPLELMLVPTARSSKLLTNAGNTTSDPNYDKYFRILPSGTPNPYAPGPLRSNITPPDPYPTLTGANVPYPHLLNFFQSEATGTTTSPQFHRILEYLNVPSWYTGTDIQAAPGAASGGAGSHAFHPPYNRISTYREPGRINLNTIYQPEVFTGLMNGFPFPPTLGNQFIRSRRGYDYLANPADPLAPNAAFPSEFAMPFRSFGGASLTPTPYDREINATLLRADPTDQTKPLFQYDSASAAEETNRNPYFRYEGLQRLGNLVTTRSNVFAVWMTVGYFEVTPGGIDATHADGFRLGRELGSDTGEIDRHRSFFMIDRTIPVGFQRGQDLNVEKAILVDRYIE